MLTSNRVCLTQPRGVPAFRAGASVNSSRACAVARTRPANTAFHRFGRGLNNQMSVKAAPPEGVSTATTTTTTTGAEPPTTVTVQQDWTISISSSGTGAVDREDDGRRLRLKVLDQNGKPLLSASTDGPQAWPKPHIDDGTKSWSRTGTVTVSVPEGSTPAVLELQKYGDATKPALDYIASVTIKTNRPDDEVTFSAESWIASKEVRSSLDALTRKPDPEMVLFAATCLPQRDTDYLRGRRAEELDKIRGKQLGSSLLNAPRSGADNVYDYQTYNDLGKQDDPRPTLGGSPAWPYPRRLATHKQTELNSKPEPNNSDPWLPFDERFNFTKATDFTAGLVSAAVPAAFAGLGRLGDIVMGGSVTSYSNFHDLAKRFSANQVISPLSPALAGAPDPSPVPAAVPPPAAFAANSSAVNGGSATAGPDNESLTAELKEWFGRLKAKTVEESPFQDAPQDGPGGQFPPSGIHSMALGEEPPTANKGKVAVNTLLDKGLRIITGQLGKALPKPRVLVNRPADVVLEDEEFGRQLLAGFNPSVIKALRQVPSEFGSAITDDDVADELGSKTLQSLVDAANAGQQPRLFIVDHWEPYAAFFTEEWKDSGKVLHAGRALLYLQKDEAGNDKALVPIAIELAAHPSAHGDPPLSTPPTQGTVFSRSKLCNGNNKNVWQLAKLIFRALDVGVHQLISHWLRCHCAIEPFLIALKRNISTAHPVYKLMLPHFRYTMSINAAARGNLVNAGGIIERTFAPGPYSMRLSSLVYGRAWRFKSQALPVDLAERGMVDAAGNPVLEYPYADDGLRIWQSMEKYFDAYLAHYYGSDADGDAEVARDTELQDWWKDVTTKAHPDLPRTKEQWGLQDPGQDKISTRAELVRILVTIAWTASAHHAAVNFGQYDNTSYPLNAPTIVRKPMPNDPKGAGWRKLATARGKDFEKLVMGYINDPGTNLVVAVTVSLLSTHSEDEHLLNEENKLLTDPKAKELNAAFIKEMKALEDDIIEQHNQGSWTRCIPGTPGFQGSWSSCLIPGSAPGLTLRGVPYSVSI